MDYGAKKYGARPDYVADEQKCIDFFKNFATKTGKKKYMDYMKEYSENRRIEIPIYLDDVESYFSGDQMFLTNLLTNTPRYEKIFADAAASKEMPKRQYSEGGEVEDAILVSRIAVSEMAKNQDPDAMPDPMAHIPQELQRRFEIVFKPRENDPPRAVRLVKSSDIGSLITCHGIVTRITEVKPFVQVATYVCGICHMEVYQRVNSRSYAPLEKCPSPSCAEKKNMTPLTEMTRGFKFIKFQELKLQELPEEVPVGNVPRSLTVYLFGERTRTCQCGDKVTVTGCWLPIPYQGFQAMRAGLKAQTYLHAMDVEKQKKGYHIANHSAEIMQQVEECRTDPDIYGKLAKSLAPEFYGLEDIKKALLLCLITGVTKTMKDGMKIRGDINILLMGDPGVAKSQLLRAVIRLAPRAVYTTGKGSSGVGLTASVMRDKVTKDMVLEAGALVLADMGICCIDEFDKMEESDRTAIHEVMEQQTVSIAKAGVTTTLNARTAVLAAANPAFGRYNKKRSAEQNINMPAALLSRFDLLWVIVDRADTDRDLNLARHIAHVHQHGTYPKLDFEVFDQKFIRAFVAKARTYEPTLPKELTEYLTLSYVQVRQSCLGADGQYDSKKIIGTPRALLSILRLSQAMARLSFRNTIAQSDIEEAMRLMTESKKSSIMDEEQSTEYVDVTSRIYNDIQTFINSRRDKRCKLVDLNNRLAAKYTQEQIDDTIETYVNLDIFDVNDAKTFISLL